MNGRVMCKDHEWLDEKPCPYCAEPKPTPSTPALNVTPTFGRPTVEDILEEWAEGKTYGKDSHFIKEFSRHALTYIESLKAQLKPQPDSSSIPDETDPCKMTDAQYEEYIYGPNRAEWPTNQTAAPPDSSSISTEQTFEDWWNKQGRLFMAGDDIHVQRVVMGVCERAWAAAKGQSNGR